MAKKKFVYSKAPDISKAVKALMLPKATKIKLLKKFVADVIKRKK